MCLWTQSQSKILSILILSRVSEDIVLITYIVKFVWYKYDNFLYFLPNFCTHSIFSEVCIDPCKKFFDYLKDLDFHNNNYNFWVTYLTSCMTCVNFSLNHFTLHLWYVIFRFLLSFPSGTYVMVRSQLHSVSLRFVSLRPLSRLVRTPDKVRPP